METLNIIPRNPFYDYNFLNTLERSFMQGYLDSFRKNMSEKDLILIEVYRLKWLIRKLVHNYNICNKYPSGVNSLIKSIRLNPFYCSRLKKQIEKIIKFF